MGKKLETPAQIQAIKELTAVHEQYIHDKASLRAKIEIEFEQRLRDAELKESRLMNVARELGVSQTRIGRIVGTTNWYTLRDKYALTRTEVLASMPGVVKNKLTDFTVDAENHTVTVHSVTLEGVTTTGSAVLQYERNGDDGWITYDYFSDSFDRYKSELAKLVWEARVKNSDTSKVALEAAQIMKAWDDATEEAFDKEGETK